MTLITLRNPFCPNFGACTPASEPSPRNSGPSSLLVSCAASLMVKGRTRTVTWMLDEPSVPAAAIAAVVFVPAGCSSSMLGEWKGCCDAMRVFHVIQSKASDFSSNGEVCVKRVEGV